MPDSSTRMGCAGHTRRALVALAASALAFLSCSAASQAAEPWGTLGNFRVPAGSESAHAEMAEGSSVAVDSEDGSIFVADTTLKTPAEKGKPAKYNIRLQHFSGEGKSEASPATVATISGEEEEGEVQGHPEIAVDPSRHRVYVLLRYERRGENAAEEKEEQKEREKKASEHKAEIEALKKQLATAEEELGAVEAPVVKLRVEYSEALEKGENRRAEEIKVAREEVEAKPKYKEETTRLALKKESLNNEITALEKPLRRAPLDSEEYVAGVLYAFEFGSGKLVAANAGKGVVLSSAALHAESETVKQALINPLGMSVDPKTGSVVMLGLQDQQANNGAVASGGAEKECRVAAQWVTVGGSAGALTAKLSRRYVDAGNAIGHAYHPRGAGAGPGRCGGYEVEEPAEWQAYSPSVTAGGRVLAMTSTYEEAEGTLWEIPAPYNETADEQSTVPVSVYTYPQTEKLDIETGAREPLEALPSAPYSVLAKPGSESEGTIFMGARYEEPRPPIPSTITVPGVLVLHYSEPGSGAVSVGEEGYVTGFHRYYDAEGHVKKEESNAEFGKEKCGLPRPSEGGFEEVIAVGGYVTGGKPAVVAMSTGAREEIVGVKLQAGGNASECLPIELSTPTITVGASKNPETIALGKAALLEAEDFSGPAKSAEWTFKYKSGTETGSEPAVVQNQSELAKLVVSAAEAGTVTRITHSFAHEGEYEVGVKVTSDGSNLVSPLGEPARTTRIKVTSSLTVIVPEIPSITVGETAKSIEARVKDSKSGDHVRYKWLYGDGASSPEAEFVVAKAETAVTTEHTYTAACSCKVQFEVLSPVAETAEQTIRVRAREEEKPPPKEEEHTTTTPPPPPPGETQVLPFKEGTAEAKIAVASLSVAPSGAVSITVSCAVAKSCSGKLTLQTLTAVVAGAAKKKKAILTLGTASFTIAGGNAKKVTLHLSAKGRALLAHAHVLRARAILLARNAEGASTTRTAVVTLRAAKKSKAKHH